jgi:phosphoribosylformimino-5-aminoimidazole carboxamide ribotide isomerase
MSFTVYPAIDVRAGRVVRLRQGDYARETTYPDSPLELARRYAEQGAQWLHLVDLDAARSGGYGLAPLVARIKADTGLQVQTGGGVRRQADVEAILQAGADRVVVGSIAIREPALAGAWLRGFGPQRLVFALDARRDDGGRWELPSHGWTEASDVVLDELLARHLDHGLRHLLCTDISRDGTLGGPNLPLYEWLAGISPDLHVQASGGVRDAADIAVVRAAGCSGVVVGKALLEGGFALDEALRQAVPC